MNHFQEWDLTGLSKETHIETNEKTGKVRRCCNHCNYKTHWNNDIRFCGRIYGHIMKNHVTEIH